LPASGWASLRSAARPLWRGRQRWRVRPA